MPVPINACADRAESACRQLRLLVHEADEMAAAGVGVEAQSLAARLQAWLDEFITGDGYFAPGPWAIAALLPEFGRLQLALGESWSAAHKEQWNRMIAAALQLGPHAPRSGAVEAWADPGFLDWLLQECTAPALRPWRQIVERHRQRIGLASCSRAVAPDRNGTLPRVRRVRCPAGAQSDAARLAVLRGSWEESAPLAAVDFGDGFALVVRLLGRTVLQGRWDVDVRADNVPVSFESPWRPLCWFADADGLYVELQRIGSAGIVLDRQLFLARKAPILVLADTIKAERPSLLELSWQIPAADEIRPIAGTNGMVDLDGPGFACRLIHAGPADAPVDLAIADGSLQVRAARTGQRLLLPLVWNWCEEGLPPAAPWKSLTLTQDRRLVTLDEAFAARIPVVGGAAGRSLIFYRSLARNLRRAFIGHQTISECVIGMLNARGELDVWLAVE